MSNNHEPIGFQHGLSQVTGIEEPGRVTVQTQGDHVTPISAYLQRPYQYHVQILSKPIEFVALPVND